MTETIIQADGVVKHFGKVEALYLREREAADRCRLRLDRSFATIML